MRRGTRGIGHEFWRRKETLEGLYAEKEVEVLTAQEMSVQHVDTPVARSQVAVGSFDDRDAVSNPPGNLVDRFSPGH